VHPSPLDCGLRSGEEILNDIPDAEEFAIQASISDRLELAALDKEQVSFAPVFFEIVEDVELG
jgi:hypothetical protein